MSNLALNTGEDFPEAAARHLEDAATLLTEGRFDNAAYLAGYVVECTVKTLLRVEQGDHPKMHNLASLSRQASELAALPGARTARYAVVTIGPGPSGSHKAAGKSPLPIDECTIRPGTTRLVSMESCESWTVGEVVAPGSSNRMRPGT